MADTSLASDVSSLLSQCTAKMNPINVRRYAKILADLLQLPHLWIMMLPTHEREADQAELTDGVPRYSPKAIREMISEGYLLSDRNKSLMGRRMDVIRQYLQTNPDLKELDMTPGKPSLKKRVNRVFGCAMEKPSIRSVATDLCFSSPTSSDAGPSSELHQSGDTDSTSFSRGAIANRNLLQGVVIDLYGDAKSRLGYIACITEVSTNGEEVQHKSGRFLFTYDFEETACCELHIGDVVTFRPLPCTRKVDNLSMNVIECFPGTMDIISFLDTISCSQGSIKEEIPPFFWLTALNDRRVCQDRCSKILDICNACLRGESLSMIQALKTSIFVTEIATFLVESEHQSFSVQLEKDVRIVVNLLLEILSHYPGDTYALVGSLTQLIKGPLSAPLLANDLTALVMAVIKSQNCYSEHVGSICSASDIDSEATSSYSLQLQDPELWVKEIARNSPAKAHKPESLQLNQMLMMNEEVVAKRKEVLKLLSSDKCSQSLSKLDLSSFLDKGQVCSSMQFNSQGLPLSRVVNPTLVLKGIIIDLYTSPDKLMSYGYLMQLESKETGSPWVHVYKFETNTPFLSAEDCKRPVHIGDTVTFRAEKGVSSIVAICSVWKYSCFTLDTTFGLDYLELVRADGFQVIVNILHKPAPWKAILNAPQVYGCKRVYKEILDICMSKSSSDEVKSLSQRFILSFAESLFIRDLPTLLMKDIPDLCHVQAAARLYIQIFTLSVTSIPANTLICLVQLVSQVNIHQVSLELAVTVLDYCIQPPASVLQMTKTWKSIPPLLTAQEFKSAITDTSLTASDYVPSLPVVKRRGAYISDEEYGHTYYTLLRADCYGELLKMISGLKSQPSSETSGNIFYDACFTGLTRAKSTNRIAYAFNLQVRNIKSSGLENDDQLLKCGNLLCFSVHGQFEGDIVWAIISEVEKGEQVSVTVELCAETYGMTDEEAIYQLKRSLNVVAVESPAYFKAYQPVLEALRTIDISKIHFRDDLLKPSGEVKSSTVIINEGSEIDSSPIYKTDKTPKLVKVSELIDILQASADEISLNESQREAVCRALSQSLSIIQGPPGTGKTYIAGILLELFLSLNTLPKDRPVIVMAYRNRALDLFLENALTFCPLKEIVRIGHLAEGHSEVLDEMLLGRKIRLEIPRWYDYQRDLKKSFDRVITTSRKVAEIEEASLVSCLHYITPNWLQSLLLEAPKELNLILTSDVIIKLGKCPQECLENLRKGQLLGKSDRDERDIVMTALQCAWRRWIDGVTIHLPHSARKRSRGSQHDFDPEEDTEQERRDVFVEDYDVHDDGDIDSSTKTLFGESIVNLLQYSEELDEFIEDVGVWDLSDVKRMQLIIIHCRYQEAVEEMKEAIRVHSAACDKFEWKKQSASLKILKRARIIGMTTTGAAIHQEVINKLECPAVFVEEAAEVLESNLLATLTPHVKHLVLIGDHKQLRPKLAYSRLLKHKFQVSLFERLISNNFPSTLLMMQSRMHKSLVPLYSFRYREQMKEGGRITSPSRVQMFKHPACMGFQFFWWTYPCTFLEKHMGNGICNKHEAMMVATLCLWMISQGENFEKITVLTPYRAQVEEIKKTLAEKAYSHPLMHKQLRPLSNVKVATIDEFQGNESSVVILSLVRNNSKPGKIGFLKQKNRMTVATSRQKDALYIIGNESFLGRSSTIVFQPFIENVIKEFGHESIGEDVPVMLSGQLQHCSVSDLELAATLPPGHPKFTHSLSSPAKLCDHGEVPTASTPHQEQCQKAFLWLAGEVTTNWKFIARRLGVRESDIDYIDHKYDRDSIEKVYQMLMRWVQTNKEVKPSQLINALEQQNLQRVACELLQHVDSIDKW